MVYPVFGGEGVLVEAGPAAALDEVSRGDVGRSLRQLAARARLMYPAARRFDLPLWLAWTEYAWRAYVHEVGGFYTATVEIPLLHGVGRYALPADCRQVKHDGVYLYYVPKEIDGIARDGAGAARVVTALPHHLEPGAAITIAGAGAGFDGNHAVAAVEDEYTFTILQGGAAAESAVGAVTWRHGDRHALTYYQEKDLLPAGAHPATEGQPYGYCFPDGRTIRLYFDPAADYPTLGLCYDAEAPDVLDADTLLPTQPWEDLGLIAYAHAEAASMLGDGNMEMRAQARFLAAILRAAEAEVYRAQRGFAGVKA